METDRITTQAVRVAVAEGAYHTAQLSYDMCAAAFDVASQALAQARTNLISEQQKLTEGIHFGV